MTRGSVLGPLGPLGLLLLFQLSCTGKRWKEADQRLESVTSDVRRAGFQPMSGPYNTFGSFTGKLSSDWTVRLDSNTAVAVGAACTASCSGVMVMVLAPGARDTLGTAPGAVTFTTRGAGSYIVVLNGRCAPAEQCSWVAQVYERGASGRLVPGIDPGKGRHR